jgi:hypothetical protein
MADALSARSSVVFVFLYPCIISRCSLPAKPVRNPIKYRAAAQEAFLKAANYPIFPWNRSFGSVSPNGEKGTRRV